MNSGNDLGILTDVGRLCFHLSHLRFSWSGNFVSQPIFKLEISLIIIFPRTKVGDVRPISWKNYTRYCNTPVFVASVWCCRIFTSNWSSCLFQEISRIIDFVSSLLRCCLAHVSLVSIWETSSSSSSSAKLECYLCNLKPGSLKVLMMFSLNVFADSTLSPSPITSLTYIFFELRYSLRLILFVPFQMMFYDTFKYKWWRWKSKHISSYQICFWSEETCFVYQKLFQT